MLFFSGIGHGIDDDRFRGSGIPGRDISRLFDFRRLRQSFRLRFRNRRRDERGRTRFFQALFDERLIRRFAGGKQRFRLYRSLRFFKQRFHGCRTAGKEIVFLSGRCGILLLFIHDGDPFC